MLSPAPDVVILGCDFLQRLLQLNALIPLNRVSSTDPVYSRLKHPVRISAKMEMSKSVCVCVCGGGAVVSIT